MKCFCNIAYVLYVLLHHSLVCILPYIFGDWHYTWCNHQSVHYTPYKGLDDQDHGDNSVSYSLNQQFNNVGHDSYVIGKIIIECL